MGLFWKKIYSMFAFQTGYAAIYILHVLSEVFSFDLFYFHVPVPNVRGLDILILVRFPSASARYAWYFLNQFMKLHQSCMDL